MGNANIQGDPTEIPNLRGSSVNDLITPKNYHGSMPESCQHCAQLLESNCWLKRLLCHPLGKLSYSFVVPGVVFVMPLCVDVPAVSSVNKLASNV